MSYGWFEGNHPWYFLFGSTCMVCLWLHVWEGKLYSAVDIGGGSSFAQALTPSRGRAQALGDGARPTFVHSENEQLLLRAVCPQAAEHNALLLETAWQRAFKKVVPRDHQCCGLMLRMPGGSWGHGIRKNCAKVFAATETVIKSLELLLATRPGLFDIAQAVSANSWMRSKREGLYRAHSLSSPAQPIDKSHILAPFNPARMQQGAPSL